MTKCIVNVATGRYALGADRLRRMIPDDVSFLGYRDTMPPGSPSHYDVPYAFKPYAMLKAIESGHDLILWADACIVPHGSLDVLWDRIERDGYWISNNGFTNYEWTAEQAYRDLGISPEENRKVKHVVATTFGLNMNHPTGQAIFAEYMRLAQTRAYCGPWWNANYPEYAGMPRNNRCAVCGPADVRGHRHDQTALSVVAYKNGCVLTDPPSWFSYRGGERQDTCLVADGSY